MYCLILIAAGILHAQCFAPGILPDFLLGYVQIATLGLLFYFIMQADTTKQALKFSLAFSLANFCTGLYWLYISMHTYGNLNPPSAAAGVFLLSLYLSLYPLLATLAYRFLNTGKHLFNVLLLAGLWSLAEWLRASVLTGFPWLTSAYAHVDNPLSAWAPIIGAYGVSFVAALCATLLALAYSHINQKRKMLTSLACIASILIISLGLKSIVWYSPAGEPISVRLIQGNTDQAEKFHSLTMWQSLIDTFDLALLPVADTSLPPQVVIFPETVVPDFQNQMPPAFWERVIDNAASSQSTYLVGAPYFRVMDNKPRYTNSILAINGQTKTSAFYENDAIHHYDKAHLVPFGEFIPYGFRWFVEAMGIPLGDFGRGASRQDNFVIGRHVFAGNICYEDIFGDELLDELYPRGDNPGATIMFNVSNLAWFGDSFSIRQHLQMARMRAQETGRPMLRSTNTGITALIGPDGYVIASLPAFIPGVLDILVQGTEGLTPYARAANKPILLIFFLIVGLALRRRIFSRINVAKPLQK